MGFLTKTIRLAASESERGTAALDFRSRLNFNSGLDQIQMIELFFQDDAAITA